MSTSVLKLANSAYFNPSDTHTTNIEYAVVKLGIDGLRSVLSAAVMQPVIQVETAYFGNFSYRLWQHSLCCAITCEALAAKKGLDKFKAYLLGLTHDIGKITLFSELSKQFLLNKMDATPGTSAFYPLLDELSASLSYEIANDWELPQEVCYALRQTQHLHPGTQVSPYTHVLYQANIICECHAMMNLHIIDTITGDMLLKELGFHKMLFQSISKLSLDI